MTPEVLQFNDCAFVARSMVAAAGRAGLHWDYLPPSLVRPPGPVVGGPLRRKATYFPYLVRRMRAVSRAQVVHVHYGTSARLLRERGVPRRPYVLTLHGSDIRRQWKDPAFHGEIQRAVDEAAHVFFANNDTADNARAARSDAEFLPALVDASTLPSWSPDTGRPTILFVSRWDADKGVDRQLELARTLARAVGPRARLAGLDWGPGAEEARRAGVGLLPRMPQTEFHALMARAHIAIGQATDNFATSEFEALCMGLPMAALGIRIGRPDDGSVPPVMQGSVDDVVGQVLEALNDPRGAARRLGSSAWALPRYDAASYVPRLDSLYQAVSRTTV
ncbi:glycosyltransferase [Arthrobacter sp. Ld5]|uniref:glycosyltransferase n=1 Tax=Arthrobacter sp. Ld5 TaxID=649152 RepID=UPI003EBC87AE